jgi:hypothetical protein
MEAVNNVIFDYERSGSRYSTGVEDHNGTGKGKVFRFQFLNNLYITSSTKALEIEPIEKHGHGADVRAGVQGNKVIAKPVMKMIGASSSSARPPLLDHKGLPRPRPDGGKVARNVEPPSIGTGYWAAALATARPVMWAGGKAPDEVVGERLFSAPVPVTMESVESAAHRVLAEAGARSPLDAVDARLIMDVTMLRFGIPLTSQKEVGGWPDLGGRGQGVPRLGVMMVAPQE